MRETATFLFFKSKIFEISKRISLRENSGLKRIYFKGQQSENSKSDSFLSGLFRHCEVRSNDEKEKKERITSHLVMTKELQRKPPLSITSSKSSF